MQNKGLRRAFLGDARFFLAYPLDIVQPRLYIKGMKTRDKNSNLKQGGNEMIGDQLRLTREDLLLAVVNVVRVM